MLHHQTNTASNGPVGSFLNAAFFFLTFIYAAAVHLVMQHALEGEPTPFSVMLVAPLIGFIFSDWASRTRLPSLLPERIGGVTLVMKTALEITGVYFLVVSFLLIVRSDNAAHILPEHFSASSAFAIFLIITWMWDWLMVYVMKNLDIIDLIKVVFSGGSLDSEGAKGYLEPFYTWRANREDRIKAVGLFVSTEITKDPGKWLIKVLPYVGLGLRVLCPIDAPLKAALQFLANHIVYANLLAGILILVDELRFGGLSLARGALPEAFGTHLDLIAVVNTVPHLVTLAVGCVVATFLLLLRGYTAFWYFILLGIVFASVTFAFREAIPVLDVLSRGMGLLGFLFLVWTSLFILGQLLTTRKEIAGAITVFLTILISYGLAAPTTLMAIMAIQQVLVNTFLHFAAGPKPAALPLPT